MKIAILYHVSFEKAGHIEDWIIEKEHTLTEYHLYDSPGFPGLAEFDMLIIMGGPMGVNDIALHPWLLPEKDLIDKSISSGKAVIGICLGAQLVASVLGSPVFKGTHKEIGWFPVDFSRDKELKLIFPGLPERMTVFHWHGDTFDLPAGSLALASSAVTPCQGFLFHRHVLALQFHAEVKPENISLMINHAGDELVTASFIQDAETISSRLEYIPDNKKIMDLFLNYFDHLVKPD